MQPDAAVGAADNGKEEITVDSFPSTVAFTAATRLHSSRAVSDRPLTLGPGTCLVESRGPYSIQCSVAGPG